MSRTRPYTPSPGEIRTGDRTWHLDPRSAFPARNAATLERAARGCLRPDGSADVTAVTAAVGALDGTFAGWLRVGREVFAFTDLVRSIPVRWRVADGAVRALEFEPGHRHARASTVPTDALAELEGSGYVHGRRTLEPDAFQVPAGAVLRIDAADATAVHPWIEWKDLRGADADHSQAALERLHLDVMADHVAELGGSRLVVPLSGGYDSRLLLAQALETGARDVLCYTFGRAGNHEARLSREVARYYGCDWTFVEYTPASWRTMRDAPWTDEFYAYASFGISIPHVMEVLAVRSLLADSRIDASCTIMPGHALDFVAGTHLPHVPAGNRRRAARRLRHQLADKNIALWPDRSGARRRVTDALDAGFEDALRANGPGAATDAFEAWVWRERQAKLIANACRAYDFHGLGWRLPWWDRRVACAWCSLPDDARRGRVRFVDYLRTRDPVAFAALDSTAEPVAPPSLRSFPARVLTRSRSYARVRRGLYRRLQIARGRLNDPMGWYELFDPATVRARYAAHLNVNSFVALDLLERMRAAENRSARREAAA